MSATPGNQFWKLRSKHGRDKIFKTPEELIKAAYEYFEHTDSRKWVKKDWVGKDAFEVNRETETPYTISGFCVYCGTSRNWWNEFKKNSKEDFLGVIHVIEDIMYTQKFEGAAVGAFTAGVISRDLGLTEKTETKIEATINDDIDYDQLSDAALEEINNAKRR